MWLYSIVTDKVLVDKQEEIEILQEKITSLTLQLMERDEKISQLMENMKGKQLLDILLYQIMCLALQSQVVQLRDQTSKSTHLTDQPAKDYHSMFAHNDSLGIFNLLLFII